MQYKKHSCSCSNKMAYDKSKKYGKQYAVASSSSSRINQSRAQTFKNRTKKFDAFRSAATAVQYGYPGAAGANIEKKSIDSAINISLNSSTTGWQYAALTYAVGGGVGTPTVGVLNNLISGSGSNQRIGRKITMKSVFLRLYFAISAATESTISFAPFRWMVIYDRQTNATLPSINSILNYSQYTAAGASSVLALQNLDWKNRFKVLADETTVLDVSNESACVVQRYINLPMDCKQVEFNVNNGGGIGDISSGALYFICWNSFDDTATGVVQMVSRVRFTDD